METKVRGGVAEDRIAGAIEAQTSRIPSLGIFGGSIRIYSRISHFENDRQARLGTLRRPVARGIHVDGCLQQNG
jgi:hypothetical protein